MAYETVGGTYYATPKTYADTQDVAFLVDAQGRLQTTGDAAAIAAAGYETVAASQTAQVLGSTGAIGDRIVRLVIQPTATTVGVVTLIDNATTIYSYPGGTVGADLKPWTVDLNMKSVSGAWKLTTGVGVTVVAIGSFT